MTSINSLVTACFLIMLLIAAPADAATLTVNSTADDGAGTCTASKCTLRDAIARAASGDTITFSLPANSAISLTNGELAINKDLILSGPGANLLTVQRSAAPGALNFRIFNITSGVIAISGLTIANGSSAAGAGILQRGGTVSISNSAISGNFAGTGVGGGISTDCASCPGNVFATMTITGSTISGNSAVNGAGISAGFNSRLTIANSTISGNIAGNTGNGGGIWANLPITITNSTISGNSAGNGGGIYNTTGTVTARNTIIALNTASTLGPDVNNTGTPQGSFTSQGFNLIGNNVGANITPATGDQIGVTAAQLNLGPLQDNGGPTRTHALLSGSTAIERGNSGGSLTDQRGFARPVDSPAIGNNGGDGSDIGAYEVQADLLPGCSTINRIVNNNNDSGADSLRAVIANVCAGSTITFAPNVTGAIDLTSGELFISKSVTINGPGANVLSVRRSASAGSFRIFNITSNSIIAAISGLTIAQGRASGQLGGGIYNLGTLTLTNTAISDNLAINGGGIHNDFGLLTVMNSTISGNTVSNATASGSGGGIFNRGGTVTITNSTISGNTANGPGGNTDSGGGIITNVGMVTLTNSTISGNSGDIGGGIRNVNGGVLRSRNTIIALNTSPSGPDVNGPLTSQGFNLIGSFSGAMITPAQLSDQLGVTAAQLNLGPLQDNGGPTQTHALLSGSFAIDKGHSSGSTTDQRGDSRPLGGANITDGDGSDIGAFEVQVPVLVVEFYNASLDHYFITWVVDEIAKLDAGTVIKGWTRTGQTFMTHTSPQSGTSPVCRYYIPPGLGDSHFFGRGIDECDATGQSNPSFVLEHPAFMQMFLPVDGNCPAGTVQVYRVFSNRVDANHRYMIDRIVRDQMAAAGWLVEGDGPDAVVMCAPQ